MRTTTLRLAVPLSLAFATACSDSTHGPVMLTAPMSPTFAKAPADPVVTSTNPSSSVRDTTLVVQVLGSGFDTGSRADFLLNGGPDPKVVTNSSAYVSSSRLDVNITIAVDAVPAYRDVAVTTGGGKKGIGTARFQVLSVEQLEGSGGGFAGDVNTSGLVVGRIGSGCNGQLPALWNRDGAVTFLPLPVPACSGMGIGVNASGEILGMVRTVPNDATKWSVARWIPGPGGYTAEFLGYWPDGSNIEPNGINNNGSISATAWTPAKTIPIWRSAAGPWVELPLPTGADCVAAGLNDADWIAGRCRIGTTDYAVVWQGPASTPVLLPRVPTRNSLHKSVSINLAGDLSGYAWNRSKSGSIQEMAVRWHFDGAQWQVQELGHLGGGTSSANAIDEDGAIVGWSTVGGKLAAFLWTSAGGMQALATLGNEAQALGVGTDVLNGRIIVGGGNITGVWRPIRWRP